MCKILLLEDDPGSRDATRRMLSQDGCEVVSAPNGQVALASLPDGVGTVLTDLQLPDMNGLEWLNRVRAVAPDLPVIVVVNPGGEDLAVQAVQAGAFQLFTRPIHPAALVCAVKRACEMYDIKAELAELRARFQANESGIAAQPSLTMDEIERQAITQALTRVRGNRTEASRVLGISVRTLQRKIKRYALSV
jgi:two-component system C4-dicarboxylate transport response regulator DctD